MPSNLGLAHFWQQGDLVTHSVAILLLVLSIASWSLTITRFFQQLRFNRAMDSVFTSFWEADQHRSRPRQNRAGRQDRRVCEAGAGGRSGSAGAPAPCGTRIGAGVNLSETVTRALRSQIVRSQVGIEWV